MVQELLTRWLKRPVTFLVLTLIVAILGLLSIYNLPMELTPSLDFPRVSVYCYFPDSSPEVIEARIAAPIESRVQRVEGIQKVKSVSSKDNAREEIGFARDTDMDFAVFQLSEILSDYRNWLPKGVARPQIQKFIPDEFQKQVFISYRFLNTLPPAELYNFIDEKIRRPLLSVPGVAAVDITGAPRGQLEIRLKLEAMRANKISLSDINRALEAKNHFQGNIIRKGSRRAIIIANRFKDINNLRRLPLKKIGKRIVRLDEVATVKWDLGRLRFKKRIDGRETALITLTKENAANTITVTDKVFDKIAGIQKALPGGNRLLLVDDASAELRKNLKNLFVRSAFALMAILAVLIFGLKRITPPIVILSSIVLSILALLSALYAFHYTLNLLTIAGMALGFGFIVDNSILVYDSIENAWAPEEAAVAVTRMFGPIAAATLTTLAALAPFVFLTGESRIYYIPFAVVISLALGFSVLFAIFYVPAAHALLKKKRVTKHVQNGRIKRGYDRVLRLLIRRRKWLYFLMVLIFGIPLWLLPQNMEVDNDKDARWEVVLKNAYNTVFASEVYSSVRPYSDKYLGGVLYLFFNSIDRGVFWNWKNPTYLNVYLRLPQGSAPGLSEKAILPFEQDVLAAKGVKRVETSIWQSGAMLRVDYKDAFRYTVFPFQLKERFISRAVKMSGLLVSVTGIGDGFSAGMLGGNSATFSLLFKGYSFNGLKKLAEKFDDFISKNRRVRRVDVNARFGFSIDDLFFLNADIRRGPFEKRGWYMDDILPYLRLYTSRRLSWRRLIVGNRETPLVIKADGYKDFDMEDLRYRPFYKDDKLFRFSEFLDIHKQPSPNSIRREDQQYLRLVSFDYLAPYRFAYKFLKKTLADFPMPVGYSIKAKNYSWGSDDDSGNLWFVIFLGLLFIYMVTASLYESFRDPLLIFLTIPSGFSGIVFLFYALDKNFNNSAYIGVVFISGIVVNNSILLVSRFKHYLREGKEVKDAIIAGAIEHARPILLTTFTTIAGFLPMALLGSGDADDIWYALALAGIGGMGASLLFILFVLPPLFASFHAKTKSEN